MTNSRLALLTALLFALLVACARQTPVPATLTPIAFVPATPPAVSPTTAATPLAVLPTPAPLPAFPAGLTTEPLQVVTTAPKDKAEEVAVGKDTTRIIVQFNHPVVPLVSVDAQKDLPQPLTLSPAVDAKGEWINTSTYALTLQRNLAVATAYTVNVAPLKDVLGQSLSSYSWTFRTVAPAILKSYPEDNTKYAGVSEPVTVTFNTEMDRSSTESAFTLAPLASGSSTPQAPISGRFEWQGMVMRFIPAQPLQYDTQYQAVLKSGAQDTTRSASTARDRTWSFRTSRKPGVDKTDPANGDAAAKSIRNGFAIDFASPMSRDAVTVSVNPTITNMSRYWDSDLSNTRLHINGGWLASQKYTVTISGQSQTRYSETLGADTVVRFTAAPLDPALSFVVNSGMYDGNGPQAVFDANVPQVVYSTFTNIDRIDYALYSVGPDDLLRLSGRSRYQYWTNYRPDQSALIRQWSTAVKAPLNASRLISTTLTADVNARLAPGAYFLQADTPAIAKDRPARLLMVVTGLNLALKRTETEGLIWATNLATGKPVSGQTVTLYGSTGVKLASGATDAQGIFRSTFTRQDAWEAITALAETDGKLVGGTGSDWTQGINAYDFNLPVQPEARQYYANLYTDRAIYRPGQTVYFRGILRRDDDASYSIPADVETIPLKIRDDQGKEVYTQNLSLSRFGTFNGEFRLSDAAGIGFYNLSFELGQDPQRFFANAGFQVAQYRAPEFQVEVKTDKPEYINGETIQVDVGSTYFFGGPVANAKVTWRLLSDDLFFNTDKVKGWWNFVDYDLTNDRKRTGGVIREGKGTTDAQGKFHFQVPADLKDFPLSQNFTLDVEITDINNQAVSNRATVPVHKGLYYIGLRPQGYVAQAGREQGVDIITVDTKGDPSPNQSLTISFFEHEWYSVREKREDGNFYWRSAYTDTLVSKVDVKTDAKGQAVAKYTPPTGGVYKIVGEGKDANGNAIRSATYQWVTGAGFVNWRIDNNDRIDLVADKKEYNVGETAQVLIPAPFKGAEALLTIERGTIREVRRLTLAGNSETVPVEIKPEYAPNVFVSVMLVKGRGADSPTPQFKLGYANLAVSTVQKQVNLQITTDRPATSEQLAQYGPGDKVTFSINAADSSGKPVETELSLALVDKAIQSLASDTAQSPLDAFYGQRGLGVMTAATLVRSTERLNQQLQSEAKGGGGGALAQEPVRRNFQDTAFWRADVVTDSNGKASVSVALPDNLTTWNLTAKGVTVDTRVAMGKLDVMSTKPLLVRPVAPRFFVIGDHAQIEAVVNNNTSKDVSADVRLDAQGLTLANSAQQPVTVKAGEKAKVSWNTTVSAVENVTLKFSAAGGDMQDALELTLPVLRPISPETVATAGQADPSAKEQVRLPDQVDASAGELRVELSPSLAAASRASLDYLEAFGYECSEQTVSKFFPNVATYLALKKLGIDRPGLQKSLEDNVSRQVQRLYSLQNNDGGWGWWNSDDSKPTLTAYALYGLYTARTAGFSVDSQVLERATNFLTEYLVKPVDVKAAPYAYNERAFVLFVLGETGSTQTGNLVSLLDKRDNLDNYGKAYLLMGLAKNKLDQAAGLASEITSAAIPSATGAHWEEKKIDYWTMNTNTRSTAIAIMALARADPKSAVLPNAVRWLMVARKEGHWETTQETAWSVLALTEFMQSTGELSGNYTYQVTLNGRSIGDGTVNKDNIDQSKTLTVAIKDLVQTAANDLSVTRSTTDGRLYYSAYLRYFLPVENMQAMNRGILVGRQYYAVDQQTLRPTDKQIASAKVGDYVQVRLTVIAPTDLHYLVLEDPLPAGFEAVDTTLKTSTAAAQSPGLQQKGEQAQTESDDEFASFYMPYWNLWAHSEIRDDRVAVFSTYLGRGTYEYSYMMRASVGGDFNTLPATAYEMYFPDVFGRSAGARFSVSQ